MNNVDGNQFLHNTSSIPGSAGDEVSRPPPGASGSSESSVEKESLLKKINRSKCVSKALQYVLIPACGAGAAYCSYNVISKVEMIYADCNQSEFELGSSSVQAMDSIAFPIFTGALCVLFGLVIYVSGRIDERELSEFADRVEAIFDPLDLDED